MADSIAETDRRFQQLSEQRLPTTGLSEPLQSAVRQSRALGSPSGNFIQPQYGGGDLVDQAIASRQNFESRRSSLVNQLPYANRRQARGITAELHGLDASERSLRWEANQRRIMAHEQASEVDRRLKLDRDTEIDEQGAGMMQTLGYLESALRNGRISKEQHDNALLEAGQRFPMALRHPEAAKHYDFVVTQADRFNQFTARNMERQAGKVAGKYGIEVQTDPETGLASIPLTQQAAMGTDKAKDEELKSRYGISLAHIRQPIEVSVGNYNSESGWVGDPKGNTIAINTGKRTASGPVTVFMSKPEYLKYGGNLAPGSMGTAQGTPVTAPVASEAAAAPQIPQIASQSDYDALPAGSTFIHNGTRYQKPQPQASE